MKDFKSEDLEEIGLTDAEINKAIASLISKGIVISLEKEGETYYQLTELGKVYGAHMDSDPSKQN